MKTKDCNVTILGDSYSTFLGCIPEGQAVYYPRIEKVADVTEVSHTWWKPLTERRNMKILINDSYSGSTVCKDTRPGQGPESAFVYRMHNTLSEKGIGGEKFFPALLDEKDPFDPDYITVAYGTNDWNSKLISHDTFEANCRAFYSRLSELYPSARIFAIAPIWRLDGNRTSSGFGAPVTEVYPLMQELCKDLPNVTVLDGYSYVPHRKEFFSDLRLHPNDFGFGLYAEALYKEILKAL